MKTAITITLLVIGTIAALGGIAHEDPRRGKNSAIVAVGTIAALAAIAIMGG